MSERNKNKARLVFNRTSASKSYINGLNTLRERFGIPDEGFFSEEEKDIWYDKLGDRLLQFVDEGIELNRSHDLSPMFYDFQEELLLYGMKLKNTQVDNQLCSVKVQKDKGVDRIHIVVNPQANLADIKDFITNNDELKLTLKQIRGSNKKTVRVCKNDVRDRHICRLFLTVEPSEGKNKYEIIAEEINKTFINQKIYAETVKKVLQRMKT